MELRIATCLSGHSRNYKDNFPNIPFDTDYFISSCMESGLPNNNTPSFVSYHIQNNVNTDLADIDNIIKSYKPVIYEFIPDKYVPDEMIKFINIKTKNGAYLQHIGMMFYRLYRSNHFKRQFEVDNNFRYDFVIRSRFDVKVNEFNINKNNLYLVCEKNKVIDLFFAGKSYIIDVISDCYNWFIKQDPDYLKIFNNGEDILYYYITQLDLGITFINNFNITFNKDYPIETKIIRNGIVLQYDINNNIINLNEWRQ